jgi:hypothetical protein
MQIIKMHVDYSQYLLNPQSDLQGEAIKNLNSLIHYFTFVSTQTVVFEIFIALKKKPLEFDSMKKKNSNLLSKIKM